MGSQETGHKCASDQKPWTRVFRYDTKVPMTVWALLKVVEPVAVRVHPNNLDQIMAVMSTGRCHKRFRQYIDSGTQ